MVRRVKTALHRDSDNDVVDAEIVDEGPEDTREGGAA